MWCPYSSTPLASTNRKRARRAVGRAATTTTAALATVFCCILSTTSKRGHGGVDAFTFAAVAHSAALSPASSSTACGDSLHMGSGGGRRRRRGAEVMLGMGGAALGSARRDAVCFCVASIVTARPREAPRTSGVRARAYSQATRERCSTAVGSTPGAPDMAQAVDAEFSDTGTARDGRDGRAAEESAGNEAEDRTWGDRWRRASPDSKARGGGRLPLPFFDVESVGLKGRWEEMGGNFLLRPPNGQAPKALLHFLGGAFVGAAPHLTYNYLLSGLAEMGFLVVATPYPLGFDYLKVCDDILDRFEEAAVPLAAEYGALPVVGIGHSCGALLQLLITCLFPDTPRAANALISFNNKPVTDAVPGFEELILPLVTQVLKEGTGKSTLFSTLEMLRETVDNLVDGAVESRFAPAVLEHEVVPLVRQVLQITDQLPGLFEQIADGTREFTPTPEETRDVVAKMYRARRTIMVRFENDSIDESEAMKDVIQEGKTLLRMRRPLVDMELRYEIIKGSHVTPLTQNVFVSTPLDSVDPLLGVRQSMKKEFLKTVNHLGQILVDWLEESAPSVSPPSSSSNSGSYATAYPADVALGAGREAGGSSPMPTTTR